MVYFTLIKYINARAATIKKKKQWIFLTQQSESSKQDTLNLALNISFTGSTHKHPEGYHPNTNALAHFEPIHYEIPANYEKHNRQSSISSQSSLTLMIPALLSPCLIHWLGVLDSALFRFVCSSSTSFPVSSASPYSLLEFFALPYALRCT